MSAPAVNTVTLVGNLTAEPKLRELPGGRKVCDLRVAVNDQERAMFIDVATSGAGAEACARHLCKGRSVAVVGRLNYREWESQRGEKRSKYEVVGRVIFGGKSDDVPAGVATEDRDE
jgi:single-strand DNA-binding protein